MVSHKQEGEAEDVEDTEGEEDKGEKDKEITAKLFISLPV